MAAIEGKSLERLVDLDALAGVAGLIICEAVADALDLRGHASFVATGGSTPGPIYDRLSRAQIGWRDVIVTLSDERWVEPDAPESNERLVRQRLFKGPASPANFVPLKRHAADVHAGADLAEREVMQLAPFDAVLLGMGEDGHIASIFPGDSKVAQMLDPDGPRFVVGVSEAGLRPFVPRVTLTLRALLESRLIVLAVTGEVKAKLIERVLAEPDYDPPVAAILRQTTVPVRILWAP